MNIIGIYTRPGCSYCVSAKKLPASEGLNFIEHDTATHSDKFMEMRQRSQHRTFPQTFIDDQLVGSFDDLLKLKQTTILN